MENKSEKPTVYPRPLSSLESTIAKKSRLSVRATKRVIAPYVKARQRPITLIKKKEENKYFSFYLKQKPSILMSDLSKFLSDSVDLLSVLNETVDVLKEITAASGAIVYMVDEAMDEIYQVPRNVLSERHRVCWKIEPGSTVAAFVAFKKEYVQVNDVLEDERFPEALGHTDMTVKAVLCVPIVTPEDECLAVIELHRDTEMPPFEDQHLRLAIVLSGWIGSAIYQNQQRLALQKQQELNDYLLDLTKCFFADTMLLDKLITEVVNFAKTALNAEHGSFYVMKKKFDELVADAYEEGISSDENQILFKKNIVLKMDKANDIIGYVARNGITMNIKNAVNDDRFNKESDKKRGYLTRSILCMPIKGVDETLGVIQVVNKKRGACFSKIDESLFQTFSIYCAFALHYARLFEKMSRTNNINNVYLDMLSHHMKPCIHDFTSVLNNPDLPSLPHRFTQFDWCISETYDFQMPQLTMYMINEIAKDSFSDMSTMVKFVLTVQKSYHSHPYHNFKHAFNVLHCMFNMLRRNTDVFTHTEMKALIISALCHDIDHLGVTNNFLEIVNHHLAQLYDESVLENHHYHVTMFIFKDLKLFSSATPEDYKKIITEVRDAILATDLAMYFKKRAKLYQICTDATFNWTCEDHRSLLKSIMMTTADLSGMCKPFPIGKKIAETVYREFYMEGDREKSMGLCPLSIMDREKQNMIPSDQIQFLTVVVLPCTLLLTKLLPNCSALYKECIQLRGTWQEVFDSQGTKVWKQEDSVPERKN